MRDFGMRWWLVLRDPVAHLHPSFFLMPDDWLYTVMLTAWVLLVAVVTYLLLGGPARRRSSPSPVSSASARSRYSLDRLVDRTACKPRGGSPRGV